MHSKEVTVKVPASSANLGSGFDTLGLALPLYTTITMKESNELIIQVEGDEFQTLPKDKRNIIYQAAAFLYKKAQISLPNLSIQIRSEIPLKRGLGSSGAAIVGGLVAANEIAGRPFSVDEIFEMANEIEGHPDNVGASLFGGIFLAAKGDSGYNYLKIPPPQGVCAVVVIPDYELSTEETRRILPNRYSKEDTVHALSHAALLAASLAMGETSYLYEAMSDRIHQPYRMNLVPGLKELIQDGKNHGALGVALSGAGPTILSLSMEKDVERLIDFIEKTMNALGVKAAVKSLPIDKNGVFVQ